MHGMKVNDSQYVHSTTLTLDISEVFFPLKRCTLEPVEKRWYFSDVIIIIYNINHTHHPPSDFFFFLTTSQCSYRSSCLLPLSAPRTLLLCILPFYFLVSHAATRLCACFTCLCVHSKVSSIVILNSDGLVLKFSVFGCLLSAVQVPLHPFVTLCLRF